MSQDRRQRQSWWRRQFLRWAMRRAPETQPIRLRQSRVYVLPTRAGVAMLGTLVVMLIASINYNLSLGYGFTFLLAGAGLAHVLHSWRTLVGLEITVSPEGEVFAGELAHFNLRLSSSDQRERPALLILDEHGNEQACVDVPSRSTMTVALSVAAPQRGWLRPALITLETRQPLGWVRAWSYLHPAVEHLVYPRRAGDLPMPFGQGGSAQGEGRSTGGVDDFAGIREFREGDSLRHVAWKSLARGQGMLTKLYEGYTSTQLVFDYAELPSHLSQEERLSQMARWVDEARQAQLRTEFILPTVRLGPAEDEGHHGNCLRQLALFGHAGGNND